MKSPEHERTTQGPAHLGNAPGDYRILGRRFDRLGVRLALGIGAIVIGPLAVGFYALSRHHVERTIEAQRRASELQSRILEVALRHQMVQQDKTLMAAILREIGSQPEVKRAMILDHAGEIRISSDPDLVGNRIPRDSPACFVCHAKQPSERERWVVLHGEREDVLRTVLPIENRPECYLCHDPAKRLNGILIVDTSLAALRAEQRSDLTWIVAGTAALALLLLAGMGFLVRRLILTRLARLGRAARAIAAGNLAERAAVPGDDVVTSLSRDFNNMADAVSKLVTEVREQETRLASVMNSLDDGLVVLDRDSRIVASNRSFCRRLGSHPEGIRGRRCREGVRGSLPCCTNGAECPAERCVATGEVQRGTFRVPTESGEVGRVEEVYASPVFDENGCVVQVVELWRDISEREKEEERLAEIERLVSLGVLASGFSHEVNTPLATILACAESLIGRIDDSAEGETAEAMLPAIRESARTIRSQVLRCRRVTEQFLRFSRGIPPSIEPLDLRETVATVASLVEPTAREAGVTLRITGEGPVPPVMVNAEVVQHVVLNLLVNAVQSCEDRGGSVALAFLVGPDVRIRIEDTGCGIPPESRRHLFEPFRSRKPRGTGLGLFLSRSFMRRFGGDICLVRSEVGAGSCFEIVFERVDRDEP